MKRVHVMVVPVVLLMAVVVLASCGSDATVGPSSQQSTTSVTTTDTITDAASPLPVGEPVEIQRFGQGIVLWKSWIDGDTVVWMQSAGAAARTGLAYSTSPGWDTVFATAPVGMGDVYEIAGVRLPAPKIPDATPWGLTLPLAWAEVLLGTADVPFKLVWAAPPETLAETYLFHGLFSWSPEGMVQELLPQSSLSLRAQASGDALAIPVPATSYSETNGDAYDPANWENLLMMTANMSAPIEVDPKAPQLPESALVGLSPYFSLLTDDGSGPQITMFDLRTGEKLSLAYPSSYPYPIIAGHYATWWTENGDVYLADLDAGSVDKVLALGTDERSRPAVALGEEWLVVVEPWSSFDRQSALKDPSEHPGADLIALHLPDLERVDFAGVVPKGQVGSVQISGDTVLLTVSPAIEPVPHSEPEWVELQTLRLALSAQRPSSTTGSASEDSASTTTTAIRSGGLGDFDWPEEGLEPEEVVAAIRAQQGSKTGPIFLPAVLPQGFHVPAELTSTSSDGTIQSSPNPGPQGHGGLPGYILYLSNGTDNIWLAANFAGDVGEATWEDTGIFFEGIPFRKLAGAAFLQSVSADRTTKIEISGCADWRLADEKYLAEALQIARELVRVAE